MSRAEPAMIRLATGRIPRTARGSAASDRGSVRRIAACRAARIDGSRPAATAGRDPSIRAARHAAIVARFLDHWRPNLALFVESDLWPNLIMAGSARDIPMILINGRVSERSFQRWRLVPRTIAALLSCFDLCLAQSPRTPRATPGLAHRAISRQATSRATCPHRRPMPRSPPAPDRNRQAPGDRRRFHASGRGDGMVEVHRKLKHAFQVC